MDNTIKISFIVPVFNVEKYIAECLDSIVGQGLEEKEVIIVNDGSTDSSLEIAERYAERYANFRIFSTQNKGQSAARNFGLDVAKGEYILFVDADDYIDKECSNIFFELCKLHNLDMIRGKYHIYFEEKNKCVASVDFSTFRFLNQAVTTREYFNEVVSTGRYEVTPILGLYSRTFLRSNKLYFPEGFQMEDHIFTLKCLTMCSTAVIMQLDYDFYTYRRRPRSTTTNAIAKNITDIVHVRKLMMEYIEKYVLDQRVRKNAYKAVSALVYQATSIYGRLSAEEKSKCKNALPPDALVFAIRHSFDNRQKTKIFLFTYIRILVDVVYWFKLKGRNVNKC